MPEGLISFCVIMDLCPYGIKTSLGDQASHTSGNAKCHALRRRAGREGRGGGVEGREQREISSSTRILR